MRAGCGAAAVGSVVADKLVLVDIGGCGGVATDGGVVLTGGGAATGGAAGGGIVDSAPVGAAIGSAAAGGVVSGEVITWSG